MYPRQDTGLFKILQCIYEKGHATLDEIIAEIGYVTQQTKRSRMLSQMVHMEKRHYLIKNGEQYSLTSELKAYMEDVLEMMGALPKKDLVLPPYKNAFTPEMKNYNLLANKRGYF